jgi:MFS family permease
MVVPKREEEEEGLSLAAFRRTLVAGWDYLRRHPIARPLTIMETVEHVPHGIWTAALMLAFTIQALHGDASNWGYQATGYFSGMIIGSLGALAFSEWVRRYPGRVIIWNACTAGLFTFIFAGNQTMWVAVVLAFVFGLSYSIRDVAQDTLLQSVVEEGQLGRVFATRDMLANVVFMFAGLFFAWLSDLVNIRMIFFIGGIMYVLTGIYALNNKALRESDMSSSEDNS